MRRIAIIPPPEYHIQRNLSERPENCHSSKMPLVCRDGWVFGWLQ